MDKQDIKTRAWNEISKFNDLDEDAFDSSAISFRIKENYNLVVWCDVDYEGGKPSRYYIVSMRFNPEDDSFGEDIGAEYCTNDITKESLEEAIEYVLSYNPFHSNIKHFEIELDGVTTIKRLQIPEELRKDFVKKNQYVREYFSNLDYKVGHISEC